MYDGENFGGLQVKLVFSLFKFHKSTTLGKVEATSYCFSASRVDTPKKIRNKTKSLLGSMSDEA